jgi:Fe2+ or Zn2+ uptake regulation protein
MNKRNTNQKRVILECLTEMGHPSASALYERVRERSHEISRATVFRVLKERAEAGEALRLRMGDGEDRYDATIRPHYHIRCLACGRVEDLELPYEPSYDSLPDAKNRYRVLGHALVFFGYCPDCDLSEDNKQNEHIKGEQLA